MSYRLGLDLGTNSIGWCLFDLDDQGNPCGVKDIGVRIFPDGRNPKDKTSNAATRRVARGMRRNRDRYLKRRKRLMTKLVEHGLMPADESERKALESLDPYELRARGLDEALAPGELGRAIFHLGQRRGFRSNRKTDGGEGDEKEAGKVKGAVSKLRAAMSDTGTRTLGEHLNGLHRERQPVRARLSGEGAKAEYELYADRDMIADEFDALWAAQVVHYPEILTEAARADLRDTLLFQRPLRPVTPGRCTLEPEDERAPWALPIAQRFRIYQELNALRVAERAGATARALTLEERDRLAEKLLSTAKQEFAKLAKLLELGPDAYFTHETEKRKDLKGDETAAVLAGGKRFGKAWRDLDLEVQVQTVDRLLGEEDEAAMIAWLQDSHGLGEAEAQMVSSARLPQGHCRLGRRALQKIVPELVADVITYDEACRRAGYHHSSFDDGVVCDRLPYYAEVLERSVAFGTGEPGDPNEERLGKIANPTVHVCLNQVRRVVNAIIAKHGTPVAIHAEVARQLPLSARGMSELKSEQKRNQDSNDDRRARLAEQGLADTYENRMRLRLWEELNPDDPASRRCVYTGEPISITRLFSNEVEIEHILPFSRTLDDGAANKTVSLRRANRDKGRHTPFEAFGHSPPRYDWDSIAARADELPANKKWRFAADAMERYDREERDFLDRQLIDTQYISRLAAHYLSALRPEKGVIVTPGRLTGLLRHEWGLGSILWDHNLADPEHKNRADHRHHAIDAAVIAATDRGMLGAVAKAAGRAEDRQLSRLVDGIPEPWLGFRDELARAVDGIVVSHKPDHGSGGQLHEDTAYGMVADPVEAGGATLVRRKPVTELTRKEIAWIRDPILRGDIEAAVAASATDRDRRLALSEFSKRTGVRRVRVLKPEKDFRIIRHGRDGEHTKAVIPGENHRIDIFELPDGAWDAEAVSVFDANKAGFQPEWAKRDPVARLVMSVHKGDLLKLEHEGVERIMRAIRLNISGRRFYMVEHNQAGDYQKRHENPDDPLRWALVGFSSLKERRARPVRVDEIGRVLDPGPP